jgi:hypothetical protein
MITFPFGFLGGVAATPFVNTYSVDFDGVDDYVETGLSLTDLSITNKFTVSCWFYADTLAAWDGIFGCASASNFNDGFSVYVNNLGVLRFFVGVYSVTTNYVETTVSAGQWYHILACYDGSLGADNVKLYIDGVAIANGVNGQRTGNVPDSGGELRIATVNSTGSHYGFNGNVDEFAVWNTDERANAATIYNSGLPADLASLSPDLWYRMGDGDTFNMLDNEQAYSNRSVDFDGINQYVEAAIDGTATGDFGILSAKEFTISFWLNANQALGVAFNWGDTHSSLYPYVLIYTNSGYITYLMWTGAAVATWVVSTIPYPLGVWGHIALSRTASDNTWRLYINGVADTTIDDTGTTDAKEANAQKVFLGEGVYAATLGNIDEVSMFTTALSQSDITSIYNGGAPNDISSLSPYSWWRMGEGDTYPMINDKQAYSHRSVDFDGVDDYVEMGTGINSSLEVGDSFTYSAWFRTTESGTNQMIMGNMEWSPVRYRGFSLAITSSNIVRVRCMYNSVSYHYIDSSAISTDTWYHVVASYDGSGTLAGMNLYIDGALDNASSGTTGTLTDITSLDPFRIGTAENFTWDFKGNIDEVAVFSSELTSGNVTTIYNSGTPNDISSFSPLSWWRMGEGDTFPTLTDSGSGSNDGTMTNMVAGDITGAQTTGIMTNQVAGDITGAETTGIMTNMVAGDIVADVPPPPPANLIFNDYGSPTAGYSLRKLDNSYSGSAIRVREDSGNTEADIGFDGSGDLDTTALLAHTGSNSGFIVKWYDQSGNSYDLAQATSTAQPQIVNSGSVLEANGKPAILYDGAFTNGDFMEQASSAFSGNTAEVNQYSVQQMISTNTPGIYFNGNINVYYWVYTSGDTSTAVGMNTGTIAYYKNGSLISSPTRGSLFSNFNNDTQTLATLTGMNMQYFGGIYREFTISDWNAGWRLNAYTQELLFWRATDLPTQADVETNINDYYTIF